MSNTRQEGYYWVKFRKDGPWFAKYYYKDGMWLSDQMRPSAEDCNFAEINETRIPSPDEVSEKRATILTTVDTATGSTIQMS